MLCVLKRTVSLGQFFLAAAPKTYLNCQMEKRLDTIHTLYPGCNIFVYITDQKQPYTSRARMDCGKLTLFLLLQTFKRGVASQDFTEKHSVPTLMFRPK